MDVNYQNRKRKNMWRDEETDVSREVKTANDVVDIKNRKTEAKNETIKKIVSTDGVSKRKGVK